MSVTRWPLGSCQPGTISGKPAGKKYARVQGGGSNLFLFLKDLDHICIAIKSVRYINKDQYRWQYSKVLEYYKTLKIKKIKKNKL